MKSHRMPKTISKWAEKNPKKIDVIEMECDDFGEEHEGPYSCWLYLAWGLAFEQPGGHIIHEATVKDFMSAVRFIVPCDCKECLQHPDAVADQKKMKF